MLKLPIAVSHPLDQIRLGLLLIAKVIQPALDAVLYRLQASVEPSISISTALTRPPAGISA